MSEFFLNLNKIILNNINQIKFLLDQFSLP